MADEIANGTSYPHYALLAYAHEMHKYTLELWMELTKKLDSGDDHSVIPGPNYQSSNGDAPRGGAAVDDHDGERPEAESPQEE